MRLLLAIVVASTLAPFAAAANPSPTRGLEWGGRSFATTAELRAWLHARGGDYEAWVAQHPFAPARLEGDSTSDPIDPGASIGEEARDGQAGGANNSRFGELIGAIAALAASVCALALRRIVPSVARPATRALRAAALALELSFVSLAVFAVVLFTSGTI